jgi:TolB-like protein
MYVYQNDPSISPQAIRTQLRRILECEGFVRCRRMQRFLEFVVEETLAGRADQLGEYAVGLAVFDRSPDFEPAVDPIVRNDARRLRLKLLEYYRRADAGQVLIDIPKGGYVPVFLPMGSEKCDRPPARARLAVFPFEVLSDTPETVNHARALCLSLTANLTNVEGLDAVAHDHAGEQPIKELTHAIEGAYMRSGERWRVIVNLIQVPEHIQVWASEYDFENVEMLPAQSQIVASVLNVVRTRIAGKRHSSELSRLDLAARPGTEVAGWSVAA